MTKTTKTANYFTINFIEKIICGSPASFKKASTGEGAAYEELLALKRAAKTLNLSKEDIEDIMYNNAANLVEEARKSIYG